MKCPWTWLIWYKRLECPIFWTWLCMGALVCFLSGLYRRIQVCHGEKLENVLFIGTMWHISFLVLHFVATLDALLTQPWENLLLMSFAEFDMDCCFKMYNRCLKHILEVVTMCIFLYFVLYHPVLCWRGVGTYMIKLLNLIVSGCPTSSPSSEEEIAGSLSTWKH